VTSRPRVVARMWEARVAPGRLDDTVRWLSTQVRAQALASGALEAAVFAAAADPVAGQPDRVVLLTRWLGSPGMQPDHAPTGAVVRAHFWDFEDVTPEG
jgi:hypothetical protein